MYLQNIMIDYLNKSSKKVIVENNSIPIKPKISSWCYEEKRVVKTFSFKQKRFLELFVMEILKYTSESDAIVEIRVKDFKVGIIIHAISPSISEIEIEAVKDVDKIKKDVMFYYAE